MGDITNFLELAKKRYSVRKYSPKPVEEDKLAYILECGRMAPSAANYQPWRIFVIRDRQLQARIHATYDRQWFRMAPVILVFCGDHRQGWKRSDGKDYTDIDVSILVDHVTLAAAEQGLGTCWICNFDAIRCREILDLPSHLEPIAYLPLGYPADEPEDISRHLNRKKRDEIIQEYL